jgi:hypothetical protein
MNHNHEGLALLLLQDFTEFERGKKAYKKRWTCEERRIYELVDTDRQIKDGRAWLAFEGEK